MHHIQAKILQNMLYATNSPYAALRPRGVESNHYAYHLEQLIKDKLVYKHDKSYSLTPLGLSYIDRLSQNRMTSRLQPQIVTAIDITTGDGQTLLFRRNFQPYIERVGFPMGRLHYEEPVGEAAARELAEKTDLHGIALVHRGIVYVHTLRSGIAISRLMYHVFQGSTDQPAQISTPSHKGTCFWADYHTIPEQERMPGFTHIKQLLQTRPAFFFDDIIVELAHDN